MVTENDQLLTPQGTHRRITPLWSLNDVDVVLAVGALLAPAHRTHSLPVSPPIEGNGEGRRAGCTDPPQSTTRSGTCYKGNVAPTAASATSARARRTTAQEGEDGPRGATILGGLFAAFSPKPDLPSKHTSRGHKTTSQSSRAKASTEPMFAEPNATAAGTAANGHGVAGATRVAGVGNPGINQVPSLNEERVDSDDDERGGGDENHPEDSDDEPNDPHEQNAAEDGNESVRGNGVIPRARPAAAALALREAERSEQSVLYMVAVLPIAILVAAMAGAPIPIRLPGLSKQVADDLCVIAGAATFGYLVVPRYMPVTCPLLWNLATEAVGSLAQLPVSIVRWGWSKRGYPTKRTCLIALAIPTVLVGIDYFAF